MGTAKSAMRENGEGRMHITVCVNVVRADGVFQKNITRGSKWDDLAKFTWVRTRNTIGEEVGSGLKRMTKVV